MNDDYTLHYAPDNASLIVRLTLEEIGLPFRTVLVDRRARAQTTPEYLALNPNGLIPVLETPQGALFETAAILLWLADRHGAMVPAPIDPDRGACLKWLFFVSNTLHADLRLIFYTHVYAGSDPEKQASVRHMVQDRLKTHLDHLENLAQSDPAYFGGEHPSILDYYVACTMRWMALYPAAEDRSWFNLNATPQLAKVLRTLETRDAVRAAIAAEGLGETPFSRPSYPQPPEGSAT